VTEPFAGAGATAFRGLPGGGDLQQRDMQAGRKRFLVSTVIVGFKSATQTDNQGYESAVLCAMLHLYAAIHHDCYVTLLKHNNSRGW
jgi:hypothetical protein